ncbi:TetR family transcriptional regulator [Actinocorallia herbida]|uniref:TetR family transcriptional regulator n=1 Tax=Actinocorallia herbida TaxID=58109 RepID=A0A3N1D344_9ACTN|nr:TetR/AcrR family transcriptional regulator [Actinocorallia herbida]ROO87906.1 TetR family transcriptional regulator [Actinocorallia herbida]
MTTPRRRHVTGESTRALLMETAERLFAAKGVEAVTIKEIQQEAGQSNASVTVYHFGSKTGLVRALIQWRSGRLDKRRDTLLEQTRAEGHVDPRAVVWLLVRPLVESIRDGEMFVPFLARLSEDPRANTEYWPTDVADWTQEEMQDLVGGALGDMPERLRRGRTVQLYNSVLNLLGEQARSGHRISELQLHNYVDAWVGMITAPVSAETQALLEPREPAPDDGTATA